MNELSKNYFYRVFFRLEIYKRSGEDFQVFFSDLMRLIDTNFIKVAAFGGDGGNDGCNPSLGHYYQIYAPKPTTSNLQSNVVVLKKSVDDFNKLTTHWSNLTGIPQMSEYYFVYNDRFQGIPPNLIPLLASLKTTNNLTKAHCIGSDEIEDNFEGLREDKKLRILGREPLTEVPFDIDQSALGQLLQHLAQQNINSIGFLSIDAPKWEEKIQFNGISEALNLRLKTASYQSHRIQTYLENSKISDSQEIAQQVNTIYQESKIVIPDTLDSYADMRYFWMVDRLIPSDIFQTATQPIIQQFRNVSEIVIANYFDTCDAYDNPNQFYA